MENPPPASDPTADDEVEFTTPPSRWPVIFGVIAIVFGLLGFLSSAFAILQSITGAMFGEVGGSEEAEAMLAAMTESWERWAAASITMSAVLMMLGLLLLVAGILLVQRKAISRPLLLVWSYAKIVFGIGALVVQFQIQREQTSAIFAETNATIGSLPPSSAPTSMSQMDNIFSAVMGAFFFLGVLWVVALPVLLLVWLNRDLVKADIGTWK